MGLDAEGDSVTRSPPTAAARSALLLKASKRFMSPPVNTERNICKDGVQTQRQRERRSQHMHICFPGNVAQRPGVDRRMTLSLCSSFLFLHPSSIGGDQHAHMHTHVPRSHLHQHTNQ